MISVCLTVEENAKLFSKVAVLFPITNNTNLEFQFSTSSPTLGVVSFQNFNHSSRCIEHLFMDLIYISLMLSIL